MTHKIEKGIPMPGAKNIDRGTGLRGLMQKMEVGDSVLEPDLGTRNSLQSAAQYVRLKTGRTFAIRKTEDGLRIWRTA